ncbi:MAG: CPBP family intramembrane metalloprotease [Chloroflexi bacterium]|nr:MAG: CPBP family intramembrane metalloprotease [Chloroflexota bacterium]
MTFAGIQFDPKLTFLIIFSTIIPMLDYYQHRLTSLKAHDRFIFYFILPMLIILILFRESPTNYGFQIGNWRTGLKWVIPVCMIMAVILLFLARTPAMQSYYAARTPQQLWRLLYLNGIELFAWEFVWRGFMLFGLARALGPGPAIFLQAVPFAFMHLGKPEIETLSTIFGGAGFAIVAWQSQSFLYPWLIHWFIASFTMLVATGRI